MGRPSSSSRGVSVTDVDQSERKKPAPPRGRVNASVIELSQKSNASSVSEDSKEFDFILSQQSDLSQTVVGKGPSVLGPLLQLPPRRGDSSRHSAFSGPNSTPRRRASLPSSSREGGTSLSSARVSSEARDCNSRGSRGLSSEQSSSDRSQGNGVG